MEQEQNKIDKRVSEWLKDRNNLIFLMIFLFGISIRLYYFFITKSQPLWWDEADYMSYAKGLAGVDTHWIITDQHNSLFPYIASVFFRVGFSEGAIKLFLEVLPSILLIFLIYKILIMMYKDKRIALISSFLMAVFWENLFNSFRFHLESLALLFSFLAIYVFWKGYERKEKIFSKINPKWSVLITVFLVMVVYSIRRGFFLLGFFFLAYMILATNMKELIKDKYNWISLASAFLLFLLIENSVFLSKIYNVAGSYYSSDKIPFNLIPFQIFGIYFNNLSNNFFSVLTYLFWIGFVILIFHLFLGIGFFRKEETSKFSLRPDLFSFLTIIITLSYFLFFTRMSPETGIGDPRWYYLLLPGAFICISKASLLITDYIQKYSKILSVVFLILLIGFGGYYELQHADMIIKSKIPSFEGIKEASLFIKENSNPDDILVTISTSQASYYAEREIIDPRLSLSGSLSPNITLDEFISVLKKHEKARYLIITFSEPNYPSWMRQEEYIQDPNTGQVMFSKWKLPFLGVEIDFTNNQQKATEEVTYNSVKFKLVGVFSDAFVYEIFT